MWLYIFTFLSLTLLFGFMGIGIVKYGLLSCYSAYGPLWEKWYLKLNVWSVITFLSAIFMIPVLLELSKTNNWQFLGFLAPVSLFAVAASPNYQEDKFQNIIHQIGAWTAVACAILYVCIIAHLWYIAVGFSIIALILSLIYKGTFVLWEEIAIYGTIYIALLIMIQSINN